MSAAATPSPDRSAATPPRRRYDSPRRRELAAQTRERIVDAGSALVHSFPAWDWRDLTFRAVAERAGVGERTVYRHFPTEADLHDAVLRRLEDEAGVSKDQRRREALVTAVAQHTADWPEAQRVMATGMLDVLWHIPSHERLTTMWNLDRDQATQAIAWAIGLLVDAIHDDHLPGSAGPGSNQG